MQYVPLLTLFRGDGFVLWFRNPKIASPSLHLYAPPALDEAGVLGAPVQVSLDAIADCKFKVDMRRDVGTDLILPAATYEYRVRGFNSDSTMLETAATGSVDVVDYIASDRLGQLRAELKIIDERIMGGDHFITRVGLHDGREVYRMRVDDLHRYRNQVQNEITQILKSMRGDPSWSVGGILGV